MGPTMDLGPNRSHAKCPCICIATPPPSQPHGGSPLCSPRCSTGHGVVLFRFGGRAAAPVKYPTVTLCALEPDVACVMQPNGPSPLWSPGVARAGAVGLSNGGGGGAVWEEDSIDRTINQLLWTLKNFLSIRNGQNFFILCRFLGLGTSEAWGSVSVRFLGVPSIEPFRPPPPFLQLKARLPVSSRATALLFGGPHWSGVMWRCALLRFGGPTAPLLLWSLQCGEGCVGRSPALLWRPAAAEEQWRQGPCRVGLHSEAEDKERGPPPPPDDPMARGAAALLSPLQSPVREALCRRRESVTRGHL